MKPMNTLLPRLALAAALSLPVVAFAQGGRDSGGGSLFVASSNAVSAILQDERVWQRVLGPLESIQAKGAAQGGTTYEIRTTEMIPVLDSDGATTGYRRSPCLFTATAVYVDSDEPIGGTPGVVIPHWEVTRLDFSACATQARK